MVWLHDDDKNSKISLFVFAQLTNVTDRHHIMAYTTLMHMHRAVMKDIFKILSPSGSQAIIEFYALVNLKQMLLIKNCAVGMLKPTTDKHEASRGLSATAELLVF